MKTNKKLFLAVTLFLATTNFALATQPTIYFLEDKSFVLTVMKQYSGFNLSIKDNNGYSLYQKHVKLREVQYQKKFDFESLPDGTYDLQIEDELKTTTFSLKIENNKIEKNKIVKTDFKPVLYKKCDKVYLNKLSFENDVMNVTIYNKQYNTVHKEVLKKEGLKRRIYQFKNRGEYVIVLSNKNKLYQHNISIND